MFEDALVSSSQRSRRWPLLLSLLGQSLGIGSALLLSILVSRELPAARWVTLVTAPPPAGAPVSAPPKQRAAAPRHSPERAADDVLTTPNRIPERVALIEESSGPVVDVGREIGTGPGVPGGVYGAAPLFAQATPPHIPQPPPVRAPAEAPMPRRVMVGGEVQRARLIHRVEPVYPPFARQTRTAGTVRLEAVIGADGAMQSLRVVSGHPLLVPSAIAAVKQWRYRPTLLNGKPVEVLTVIEVHFRLR